MSWFSDAFGVEKKSAIHKGIKVEEGMIAHHQFDGTWQEAQEKYGDLTDGLNKLLNYAMNAKLRSGGQGGIREVGEKIVFQLNKVEVGVRDDEGHEVPGQFRIGDYEVEVRRVR